MEKGQFLQNIGGILKSVIKVHVDMSDQLDALGLHLIDSQFEKLAEFVQLLHQKNEELNLTAIRDIKEIWIKHVIDSLAPISLISEKKGARVLDLGTGGGLPGIPLAICLPNVAFTLMDSTNKKIEAVAEFAKKLGLKNVLCIHDRAEHAAHLPSMREQYDFVVSRAVAPLKVLAELTIPFICPYGKVLSYKSQDVLQELAEARTAIVKLKAEPPRISYYELPEQMGQRSLIILTKKWPTPDTYPRREGLPSKKPL